MAITILTAVAVMAVLTFLLASMLIIASKKWHVIEDPRLDQVEDMLPHNNCGGCGYPSCRLFAEALIASEALPGKCSVSSKEERIAVATFLDVDVGAQTKRVARLACAGGNNVATSHAIYSGEKSCIAAAQVVGGGKTCSWGCMGYGDCERVCEFDAINLDEHGLPVVDEQKCTACGDCVDVCPKALFSLQSVDHPLWVRCKNLEMGDQVLDYCKVGCTACGKCAADAPDQTISMHNHLPLINESKNKQTDTVSKNAIQRCPTGAIVWLNEKGEETKGPAAYKVLRHSSLPSTES